MGWSGVHGPLKSRVTLRNSKPVLRKGDLRFLKGLHSFIHAILAGQTWLKCHDSESIFLLCIASVIAIGVETSWIDWENPSKKNQSCSFYKYLFSDTWNLYTPALHWQWRLCFFKKNRISVGSQNDQHIHLAQRTLRNIHQHYVSFLLYHNGIQNYQLASLFWTGSLNNAMSEFVLNLQGVL